MISLRSNIGIIVCMVLFSVFSGSCCKDEGPTEPANDMALVGNWKLTKMSSEYQGETETFTESQLDSLGLVWKYEIEDDGTIEQTTNISGTLITMPGTWETSANKLTMILTEPGGGTGTLVYEYLIIGNILKLDWDIPAGTKFYAEFTKQ